MTSFAETIKVTSTEAAQVISRSSTEADRVITGILNATERSSRP